MAVQVYKILHDRSTAFGVYSTSTDNSEAGPITVHQPVVSRVINVQTYLLVIFEKLIDFAT
jgi:hypothetical protein